MLKHYIDRLDATECTGWAFDTDNHDKRIALTFLVNDTIRHLDTADLYRPDLATINGPTKAGFSFGIASLLSKGFNKIELVADGYGSLFRTEIDGRNRTAGVERGQAGWLFLTNDSNDIDRSLTGMLPNANGIIDQTVKTLTRRAGILAQMQRRNATIIVPEKNVLCNEKRREPLALSDRRPALALTRQGAETSANVSYPWDVLGSNTPETIFLKTDTHLAQPGLILLFEHAMRQLGLALAPRLGNKRQHEVRGDLGSKLDPAETETVEAHDLPYAGDISLDEVTDALNGTRRLTGSRLRYVDENARTDSEQPDSVFILGTSTAYRLLPFFFQHFRKVDFRWGNTIPTSKLAFSDAQMMVAFINERYLCTPIEDPETQ